MAVDRLEPELDDFAREEVDLVPPDLDPLLDGFDRLLAVFDALLRDPEEEDFAREELPELLVPELLVPELLEPDDRPEPLLDELEPEALPSADHLPLITRCAASATASAIIEPSLVALESMLPAARSAVSAASSPASRIFLRAAGLALIAAAAAARPAASISLLIAALASLSTELSFELEEDFDELEREEVFLEDLAIVTPSVAGKRHFKAVPVPE